MKLRRHFQQAIRKRDRIHYKAKSTNKQEHWQTRNDVINLVRLAKEEYKKKLTSQLRDKTIPPGAC
jgi:anionic cell wall polymer biosynthesis LytR-Cps2A-Psr (LCP) family protein